jgi:hypothetical protein
MTFAQWEHGPNNFVHWSDPIPCTNNAAASRTDISRHTQGRDPAFSHKYAYIGIKARESTGSRLDSLVFFLKQIPLRGQFIYERPQRLSSSKSFECRKKEINVKFNF